MRLTRELLSKIESMTQFPKIHTFHAITDKQLTEIRRGITNYFGGLTISEKFNGANVRMIFWPDETILIASRSNILTCVGDFVYNDELGIVETMLPIAMRIAREVYLDQSSCIVRVIYGEVYGGKATQAWRNYGDGESRFRMFDMADFDISRLEWSIEDLASWRDNKGEQAWYPEALLQDTSDRLDLPLTTRLAVMERNDLPQTIADVLEWGAFYRKTTDGPGESEGVVITNRLHSGDRDSGNLGRLKIRWRDYDKEMRRRQEVAAEVARLGRVQAALARKQIGKEGSRIPNR